jgi:hypothetical protein
VNPLVDVMHAYPKHVCPLDHIHVVIFLVVWWLTSWPLFESS